MKYLYSIFFLLFSFAFSQEEIASKIANELLNERYNISTRRSESVVKKEYIEILDEWFDPNYLHFTYPQNSRGSLCRMTKEEVEFFVNIPKLYQKVKTNSHDKELVEKLKELELSKGLSAIRDNFVEALELVGDKDYEVEWQHELTRDQYDIDLTDMTTAYDIGNLETSKRVIPFFEKWLSENSENFIILDAGVGSGNTIKPFLHYLIQKQLPQEILNKITILLFDIDPVKTTALQKAIVNALHISDKLVVVRNGQLNDIENCFIDYDGKINCIMSGAAICHVSNKSKFFKSLYNLMVLGGEVIFWDPFFPLNNSTYLRVTNDEEEMGKRFVYLKGDEKPLLKLNKGEKLSEEILKLQAQGNEIVTISKVSQEIANRIAAFSGYIYPLQAGYRLGMPLIEGGFLTKQDEDRMVKEATNYILKKLNSNPGYSFFEYIQWLNSNEQFKKCAFFDRSKYQFIEAYEDFQFHKKYCEAANFQVIYFNYLTSSNADAVSAGCGLIHLRK